MTEAQCDSCNDWTMGCPLFSSLCLWLVSPVTLVFMSQSFGMYLVTMLSLKEIDINWLFCVIDKFMIMMLTSAVRFCIPLLIIRNSDIRYMLKNVYYELAQCSYTRTAESPIMYVKDNMCR